MQLLRTLAGDVKNAVHRFTMVHPGCKKKRWGWCRFPCRLLVCIFKIDLFGITEQHPEVFFNVAIRHPNQAFDDMTCSTWWDRWALSPFAHVLLLSVSSAAWNAIYADEDLIFSPMGPWKNPRCTEVAEVINVRPPILVSTNLVKVRI